MRIVKDHNASGIELDAIASEYELRNMDGWSDVDLGVAVADIVATSRAGKYDSFVLHAPLELAARCALLSHARPSASRAARLRILSIASQYESFGPAADAPEGDLSGDCVELFVNSVRNGDSDTAEQAALTIAAIHDPGEIVAALAEFLIPLTSAAAHAPIFLHLLQRADPRGAVSPRLLAPLSRELARTTGRAIHWVDDWSASRASDARALEARLLYTPSQPTGLTFIHPIMESVDSSGFAADRLAGVVGTFSADAARAVLRVAARSMIEDTPDHAPYGWTHCLTIPQAVLNIAHATTHPEIALAIAATQVLGFRAALGQIELTHDRPLDSYNTVDIAAIIDAASGHHDAHLAKYVLACLDAAAFDPDATPLYHAAAAHLLDVWADQPVQGDPLEGKAR